MQWINSFPVPLPRRIWWPWSQPVEMVAFQRKFEVGEDLEFANLFIAASGDCTIWLDEESLPVVSGNVPSWRSMQKVPCHIAVGSHILAFQAQPGDHGQPFLLACLDWKENGVDRRLATDGEWEMVVNFPEGWQEDPEKLNWRKAWAFDGVWAEPWGMPCNAPLDFCRMGSGWQAVGLETLSEVASLFQGLPPGVIEIRDDNAIHFRPAQPYAYQPPEINNTRPRLEWYRTREAHSLILNNWLDLFEPRSPQVVLDAGEETFARLRIQVRSGGPAWLAITTGESIQEVQRYARRVTDIFELRDGESYVTAPTGFRYAKVMALSCHPDAEGVILEPVEVQHIRYPITQRGSFRCNDEMINAIWKLSERTAHLCMQNEVWDGIKRDQLPWMGDLYTEALAIYHLFGDYRLTRRTLAALAEISPAPTRPLDAQRYPGLVAIWKSGGSSHPGAGSGDINGIPSYTLWWILGLYDYWLYSGDASLIHEVADELEATLAHVVSWVDRDGIWRFHGGWDFIDWSPVKAEERERFCHLLACRALQAGVALLDAMGKPGGDRIQSTLSRMIQASRESWWQSGQGTYGSSHQVNAMAIRSGILDRAECAGLFVRTLAPDPEHTMTFWHRYLDLEAAAIAGQVTWGLAYLRNHWEPMVSIGASTLWEAFDPAWLGDDPHAVSMVGAEFARYGGYETSLCHGWSAGPAAWLQRRVLGVSPVSPGFTRVRFDPDLGSLEWAEGEIPTPHGMIKVALKRDEEGNMLPDIQLPPGIEITR